MFEKEKEGEAIARETEIYIKEWIQSSRCRQAAIRVCKRGKNIEGEDQEV